MMHRIINEARNTVSSHPIDSIHLVCPSTTILIRFMDGIIKKLEDAVYRLTPNPLSLFYPHEKIVSCPFVCLSLFMNVQNLVNKLASIIMFKYIAKCVSLVCALVRLVTGIKPNIYDVSKFDIVYIDENNVLKLRMVA